MQKVSFGSMPLTEIKKEDRKCLDRYLIKTFSDNISISDAIRNLSLTKNLMYITPDALMKDWLGSKKGDTNVSDRQSNTLYEGALKRAFHILREFYSQIKNAPFYKEFIYYPIYIEKVDKVTGMGGSTDVTMNYSFVILSNDLTKNLKIDEIRYDENASLNFLYLFIEFFSAGEAGLTKKSIHDFNKDDYEFLVKLYQFIEKSGKEPIQMVLDLYKIIGLLQKIQDAKTNRDTASLVHDVDTFFKDVKIDDLKRYKGMLRHKFITLINSRNKNTVDVRKSFIELMNNIFTSDGLKGLYGEIDTSATRGERYKYIYNSTKYREVLNLAKELVSYNALVCKDVVSNDQLEMDFRIENNERTLDISSGQAAQKYQTFFKDYVDSIKNFFEGMVSSLVKDMDTVGAASSSLQDLLDKNEKELTKTIGFGTLTLADELATANKMLKKAEDHYDNLQMAVANANMATSTPPSTQELTNAQTEVNLRGADIARLNTEIQQRQDFIDMLKTQIKSVPRISQQIDNTVTKEMVDHLVASLVTNLTFVYDDGKRFFSNDLVAQGLVDLAAKDKDRPVDSPAGHDLTTYDGFKNTLADADNNQKFPHTTVNKDSGAETTNPSYLAASVAHNLGDAFQVMAKDTMATFDEHIVPILQKHYRDYIGESVFSRKNISASGSSSPLDKLIQSRKDHSKSDRQLDLISDMISKFDDKRRTNGKYKRMEQDLQENIFQNRFIEKVLKNFLRLFDTKNIKSVIEHDQSISQLHPLIKKLLKNGDQCQFFKSFIIDYDMTEQLYRLKFITDTQKFLDGITHVAPRKFNDPMNRMQTVLNDYLGLANNPTWVTSKTNIYLSMPDDLSLTGTSILSKIPQTELRDVCRIKMADYWNDKNMGQAVKFGNPKVNKLRDDIAKIRENISKRQKEAGGTAHSFGESVSLQIDSNQAQRDREAEIVLLQEADPVTTVAPGTPTNSAKTQKDKNTSQKSKKGSNKFDLAQKDIDRMYKDIERKNEEIRRVTEEFKEKEKPYLPNMFVFEDPDRAENQPLMSDQEMKELSSNRDKMEQSLRDLNPYDDSEVKEMTNNQERIDQYRAQEQRSHPFDFEDRDRDRGRDGRYDSGSSRGEEKPGWMDQDRIDQRYQDRQDQDSRDQLNREQDLRDKYQRDLDQKQQYSQEVRYQQGYQDPADPREQNFRDTRDDYDRDPWRR